MGYTLCVDVVVLCMTLSITLIVVPSSTLQPMCLMFVYLTIFQLINLFSPGRGFACRIFHFNQFVECISVRCHIRGFLQNYADVVLCLLAAKLYHPFMSSDLDKILSKNQM